MEISLQGDGYEVIFEDYQLSESKQPNCLEQEHYIRWDTTNALYRLCGLEWRSP
ncbi:MAG: hypothetical protein KME50_31655 [Nostoc desertorum CM1-VF14]|nr:hypothetical protein [Nostoc desertorum CM1-VF14]